MTGKELILKLIKANTLNKNIFVDIGKGCLVNIKNCFLCSCKSEIIISTKESKALEDYITAIDLIDKTLDLDYLYLPVVVYG